MENLIHAIITLGYVALFLTVFAESGLFFGFFLPGDSLLFTAGIFAARGDLNIVVVVIGCTIAAIAGDQVGYLFGAKMGDKLFRQKESFFLRKDHLEKTEAFYNQYGAKTIVLARFIPIVRTFAPIIAGAVKMDYAEFVRYNILGGLVWAISLPLLGYYLGKVIPSIDRYLLPIIVVIVIASIIPAIKHLLPSKHKNNLSEPEEAER